MFQPKYVMSNSRSALIPTAVLFAALAGCNASREKNIIRPAAAPSFVRVNVSRGVPESISGAQFVVRMTDADGARTFAPSKSDAPFREYPISTNGSLGILVTVRGDNPAVTGDATATIPLQPDLLVNLFVYAWSPSMDPRLYGCMCPNRIAFPLQASTATYDSLIIAWEPESRSRPSPIR
jgi:hypothetical protein